MAAVSPSVTEKVAAGTALPRLISLLETVVMTGAFTIWIGTVWTTLPLVPPADHGEVSVSVSLVAAGLANSSKS